jgi:ceramide glucosyltransferase
MDMKLQLLLLIPVLGGSVYALLCAIVVGLFFRRTVSNPSDPIQSWPKVTILKPVHGLEKNLAANLRSACTQDYPDYQVVFSVQRLNDPALPLLRQIAQEFGSQRVSVVAIEDVPVVNGKVQNLINALTAARHDILVISDSDVLLRPDYLKTIIAPLTDPKVGYVCTLYRGTYAKSWFEQLERLTYNADFIPSVIFAHVTGASDFCLGPSLAFRRSTLELIGGLESLADYLVEDYELGRRILAKGYKMVLVAHLVDLVVDLKRPGDWWHHQLYWDQNTWAARPVSFIATLLTRGVPFALLYAAARLFDPLGLLVLIGTIALRTGTAAYMLHLLQGQTRVRELALLPLRDLAGLLSWITAIGKRSFVWRGHEFRLTREGRIAPRSL